MLSIRLYHELCHEINIKSGALLQLVQEAGIEGYEMQSKIMYNFNALWQTISWINQQKAKERADREAARKKRSR